MRVHPVLAALVVLGTIATASATPGTGAGGGGVPPVASEESLLADLCRGSELCRQVVLMRSDSVTLLRVSFIHSARFVDEGDDYCDAREYWYIKGKDRLLLTRDCAEQWGADGQGPVQSTFDGKRLQLEYLEWQSSDGCERSTATIDWQTGKVLSSKRWTGKSRARRTECVQQKSAKPDFHFGAGSATDPVVTFHR